MPPLAPSLAVVPLALLAIAAMCDLRWRTIPNTLTGSLAAGGLIAAAVGDPQNLLVLVAAAVAVLLGGAALFALRMVGGGDVKLASAVTLWLPTADIPAFLVLTAMAGGVLGLGLALAHTAAALRRGAQPRASLAAAMAVPAPYGIAIASAGAALIVAGG